MMSDVKWLRDQIADLQSEQRAMRTAPRSHAEIRPDIAVWCEAKAAEGDQHFERHLSLLAKGESLDEAFKIFLPYGGGGRIDLAPVLASLFGAPALTKAIGRRLAQMEDGPTTAERESRLAEIGSKLFELERSEENLIEESEAAGSHIERRADADPRAVLWVDAANAVGANGSGE